MIVKVQVPIDGSNGPAMVYDQKRRMERMIPITRSLRRLMQAEVKIYCEATVEHGEFMLGKRVADQDW